MEILTIEECSLDGLDEDTDQQLQANDCRVVCCSRDIRGEEEGDQEPLVIDKCFARGVMSIEGPSMPLE